MKNISVCLISIIVLAMIGGMASASGIDSLSVGGATQGPNGDNVDIFVNVTNASNVGNLTIDLLFDKNVMIANNVTEGDLINGSTFSSNVDNSTGKVSIDVINLTGISGSGTIAKINFNAVGTKGDSSSLNISVTNITDTDNNQIIPQNISNSTFKITDTPPTTTVSISGTAGENGWYTSNVAVSLTAIDHSGLGINETKYIINGMPNTYTTPFGITNEGVTMVDYYSVDNIGITEVTKELTVKIDKNKPTIIAPANITTNATGPLTYIDIGIPTVNDTVDINPNVTFSIGNVAIGNVAVNLFSIGNVAADLFPIGNTAVTWTATDEAGNANMAIQYIEVVGPNYPFISDFNITPNTHIGKTNPAIASAIINKSKDGISSVEFGVVDANNLTGGDIPVLTVFKNFSGTEGLYNTEPWYGNYAVIGNIAVIGNMAVSDIGNMAVSDMGNIAVSGIGNIAVSGIGNIAVSTITIQQESDAPGYILARGVFKNNVAVNEIDAMLWFNKITGILSNITNLITDGGTPLNIDEGNSTFQTEIDKYVNGLDNSPEYVTGNGQIFTLYDINGNLAVNNPHIIPVQVPNGNYKAYVNASDANGSITKFVDIDTMSSQPSTGGGGTVSGSSGGGRGGGSSGGGFNSQGNGTYFTNGNTAVSGNIAVSGNTAVSTPETTIVGTTVPGQISQTAQTGQTAVPVTTKKSPGFEIVVLIGTISAIYLYRRMGR